MWCGGMESLVSEHSSGVFNNGVASSTLLAIAV